MPLCTECNDAILDFIGVCDACSLKYANKNAKRKRKDSGVAMDYGGGVSDAPIHIPKKVKEKHEPQVKTRISCEFGDGDWWEAKSSGDKVYLNFETVKGDSADVIRPLVALAKIIPRKVGARGSVPSPFSFLTAEERQDLATQLEGSPPERFKPLSLSLDADSDASVHLWSDELYAAEAVALTEQELQAENEAEAAAVEDLDHEDEQEIENEDEFNDKSEEEEGTPMIVQGGTPSLKIFTKPGEGKAPADIPLPSPPKETDLDRLTTMFDKGHLFALALGGIDHCGQIVPQVRTCNRGTWLRMETRIAGRDWKSIKKTCWEKIEQQRRQIAQQSDIQPSQNAQPMQGNFKMPNALAISADFIGKIYIFYPQQNEMDYDWDKLIRIPLWFYFQIYFVTGLGETLGVAHYSIGNGRSLATLKPSEAEIEAFQLAHKTLGYKDPALKETQEDIAAEHWYPDPPYAALQWLSDSGNPVIKFRNFSAAGFASAQIDIIRKYNGWLNGGAFEPDATELRSDHRPEIRNFRIKLADFDRDLFKKLIAGSGLSADDNQRLGDLIAVKKRQLDELKVRDEACPKTNYTLPTAKLWSQRALTQEEWDGVGHLQRLQKEIENKLADINLKRNEKSGLQTSFNALMPRIQYLRNVAEPQRQWALLTNLKNQQKAATSIETIFAQDLVEHRSALHADLTLEQPDLYETLDITGGRGYPEVDHVVPKGNNGLNRYDNARLVSFAQNHIYRDKVYLNPKLLGGEKARQKAQQRCQQNYEKEKSRTQAKIVALAQHARLVDEFRINPDERLIPLIQDFITHYDVKLDDRSERPDAPADLMEADDPAFLMDEDEGAKPVNEMDEGIPDVMDLGNKPDAFNFFNMETQ